MKLYWQENILPTRPIENNNSILLHDKFLLLIKVSLNWKTFKIIYGRKFKEKIKKKQKLIKFRNLKDYLFFLDNLILIFLESNAEEHLLEIDNWDEDHLQS